MKLTHKQKERLLELIKPSWIDLRITCRCGVWFPMKVLGYDPIPPTHTIFRPDRDVEMWCEGCGACIIDSWKTIQGHSGGYFNVTRERES